MPITIDIEVTQSDIDAHWQHYSDPQNCPIYHACQRQFPESNIFVGGHHININGDIWSFDRHGLSFSYAIGIMLVSNGKRAAKPCRFTITMCELKPLDIYQKEELVV